MLSNERSPRLRPKVEGVQAPRAMEACWDNAVQTLP